MLHSSLNTGSVSLPEGFIREPELKYLIRLTVPTEELDDLWELQRDLERLGGRSRQGGSAFSFYTRKHRDEAAEVLIDKWGSWYFESIQVGEESQPRLLLALPTEANSQSGRLAEFLRHRKFSVEVAEDVSHAMELLPVHQPHAVIVGTELKQGGVEELLRRLQQAPQYREIPVILLEDPQRQVSPEFPSPIIGSFSQPFIFAEVFAAILMAVRKQQALGAG